MTVVAPFKTLRIAQVSPLWMSIPPQSYGGTELMIHLLTESLVQRGHHVTLYASSDARTSAELRSVVSHSVADLMAEGVAEEYEHYVNALMARVLSDADEFDVIHCHLGGSRIPLGSLAKTPVLHTLHITPSMDDQWAMRQYPQAPIAAISKHQASFIPDTCANVAVIHHGIDFEAYSLQTKPKTHLTFLARMSLQKSPMDAIRIAKRAKMPLVIAGKAQNAEEAAHLKNAILPLVDGVNVIYRGGVNHAEKNELLGDSAALLFPIQGSEGFGLVMAEAMACGTPVIGWNRASVPEIVDDGVTGFYGSSVQELASFVPAAMQLDRRKIREKAISRFSHHRMTDDYIKLYQSLVRVGVE